MPTILGNRGSGFLTCVNRIVIHEHVVSGPLEVVELAALEREPEHPRDHEYEGDGEGNEEDEASHGSGGATGRSALRRTTSELAAMPSAASQGPSQPAAASGRTAAL